MPLEITISSEDRALLIKWQGGHAGFYPFDFLRGACPCAVCKGHHLPVDVRKVVPAQGTDLIDVATVGRYAFRFLWSDAHDTGIYNYEYLRSLCQCETCTA